MRRFERIAVAAARSIAAATVAVVLLTPVLRASFTWYVRDSFELMSPDLLATTSSTPLEVRNATLPERTAIGAALAQLRLPEIGTVDIAIGSASDSCGPCLAYYTSSSQQIVVDRSIVFNPPQLRIALGHEIGHLVDDRLLHARDRARFSRMREHADGNWLAPDLAWQKRPAEDFAETFSVLVQPTPFRGVMTDYGRVDAAELERLLAGARVRLPEPRPPRDLEELLAREIEYAQQSLSAAWGVVVLTMLAGLAATAGAIVESGTVR